MVELIKIGIVFFIVLLLTFKKVNLWMALLLGTFLLGFLFRLPFQSIVKDVFTSILAIETLLLLGAFIAILFFSSLLDPGSLPCGRRSFGHFIKVAQPVAFLQTEESAPPPLLDTLAFRTHQEPMGGMASWKAKP